MTNVKSFSHKNNPEDLATINYLETNYPKPGISKSEAIMALLNKGVKGLQENGNLDNFTEEQIYDLNGDIKKFATDIKNLDNREISELNSKLQKLITALHREVMKRGKY